MNGSLFSADRATHLRVILTASFGAMLVVLVAIGGRGMIAKNMAGDPAPKTRSTPSIVPPAISRGNPRGVANV